MLIYSPGIEGVPGIGLVCYTHVDEPVMLQRFPECSGCMGRNPSAYLCHPRKFFFPSLILLFLSHLLKFFCVSPRINHQGISHNIHTFEFLYLLVIFRIPGLNLLHLSLYLSFYIQKPHFENSISSCSMSRRSLLHELGPNPCFVGILPFLGKIFKDYVSH